MMRRDRIPATRRWVVKIGSALLTANGRGLDLDAVPGWVRQIAAWCGRGHEVVLVSSGAVAEGMSRLGWARRPSALHELQAAARHFETMLSRPSGRSLNSRPPRSAVITVPSRLRKTYPLEPAV